MRCGKGDLLLIRAAMRGVATRANALWQSFGVFAPRALMGVATRANALWQRTGSVNTAVTMQTSQPARMRCGKENRLSYEQCNTGRNPRECAVAKEVASPMHTGAA